MKSFATGLLTGAVIAAGIALVSHPKDMRKLRHNSRRAIRGINRAFHHKWH